MKSMVRRIVSHLLLVERIQALLDLEALGGVPGRDRKLL